MKWPLRNPFRRRRDHFEGILELFDDHVHIGEVTVGGRYVPRFSGPTLERFVGAKCDEQQSGELWDSCVHPLDRATYMRFWGELLAGRSAAGDVPDAGRRRRHPHGLAPRPLTRAGRRRAADPGARVRRDQARGDRRPPGRGRHRFMHLLDVVGEHVYRAVAHPDGRIEELFQGPGADRLLGGADPDGEMENWNAAIHPDDRPRSRPSSGARRGARRRGRVPAARL